MLRNAWFRSAAPVAAVTMVLAGTASAVAAGGNAPRLGRPNHKHVKAGHIKLVVNVPLPAARDGVFIVIDRKKRRDRFGHLKTSPCSVSKGCDDVIAHHVSGHKYVYTGKANFPGYWAVTPGKYYWQVQYFTVGDTANYYSPIGAFYVK
jgi:hypothetical protein